MDWSNQEVLSNPNLSYTSRDFSSIYSELVAALPELSKTYTPADEADPGIVLIKLISMLGDMLSHTADINALEVFPATVLQLPNAQQIFRLVGYKMKWYRSAHCEAYFTNANSVPISIGRYSEFTTKSGYTYTNLSQIEIPAGASVSTQVKTDLVQGSPITPTMISTKIKPYYTGEWYDNYAFNINVKRDVANNRIYLSGQAVDGSTITLVDDDSSAFATNEWQQVDNLNTITEVGKYYEFDFDSDGQPFIQLPEYWSSRYMITQFKIFYVVSDGRAGEITSNSLVNINTSNVIIPGGSAASNYMDNVKIYNSASTYGNSPETSDEARKNAELWVNTVDTIITVEDFTKATKRIMGVANAIATDKHTDPDGANMTSDDIKLYIIRKDGYKEFTSYNAKNASFNTITDEIWAQQVIDEFDNHKLAATYKINPVFENSIDWIDWTVKGSLWLRQPVPKDKNHDILVQINNGLSSTFSPSVLNFGEAINYIDVIDNIKAADKLIYHVDLDTSAIEYSRVMRDNHGNKTGLTIKPKYRIIDGSNNTYTYYYTNGFGCAPIPGGDGTNSGTGFRILREDGVTWVTNGLDLGLSEAVNELEIYNNHIYNWTGEDRIDTGYKVVIEDDDIYIADSSGNKTKYHFESVIPIYLSDGKESTEYLKEKNSNGTPCRWEGKDIYEIWDSEYNQWTSKFIYKDTGEMCIVRAGKAYSMNRFCQVPITNGETDIVDGFGMPLMDGNGNIMRQLVAKEELTGRYEQTITPKLATAQEQQEHPDEKYSRTYDFYLGQTHEGEQLRDSLNHDIIGFPIRPDGLHIMIDTDRYIIHDNGSGVLTGSNGILDGYGSIDYATGHIQFTLAANIEKEITSDISSAIKIIYYKNVITMARYNQFDPETFYIQPQFLRYNTANRSLG